MRVDIGYTYKGGILLRRPLLVPQINPRGDVMQGSNFKRKNADCKKGGEGNLKRTLIKSTEFFHIKKKKNQGRQLTVFFVNVLARKLIPKKNPKFNNLKENSNKCGTNLKSIMFMSANLIVNMIKETI